MGTLKLISASCLALLMFYASLSSISKFLSRWLRSRLSVNLCQMEGHGSVEGFNSLSWNIVCSACQL